MKLINIFGLFSGLISSRIIFCVKFKINKLLSLLFEWYSVVNETKTGLLFSEYITAAKVIIQHQTLDLKSLFI